MNTNSLVVYSDLILFYSSGYERIVKMLIQKGANVNSKLPVGTTPLFFDDHIG